jgi:hypothetical protein
LRASADFNREEAVSNGPELKAEAVLKVLMDHHLHQDRLLWNQIRTVMTIQAAILTAGYVLRGSWHAYVPLSLAIVFTLLMYLFIKNCRQTRDMNIDAMNNIVKKFSSPELISVLHHHGESRLLRTGFWFGRDRWFFWLDRGLPIVRAHTLLQFSFWLFVIMDIVAAESFRGMKPASIC